MQREMLREERQTCGETVRDRDAERDAETEERETERCGETIRDLV